MRRLAAGVVLLLALGIVRRVGAQSTRPIVDRDYAIDLHSGAVSGSPRTIGMAGAATALAEGSGGMLANPAAVAARPHSARAAWDWDASVDASTPGFGTDFDNDGNPRTEALSVGMGDVGLVGLAGRWGLGVSATGVTYRIAAAGAAERGELSSSVLRLVLGRAFLDEAVVAGLGVRVGSFTIQKGQRNLFQVSGGGLEAGVVVNPRGRSWRVGARGALPAVGAEIDQPSCDPFNCEGHILPERAVTPWETAVGVAWRLAPRPWNHVPTARFADERAWTLAADIVVSGRVAGGAGIEAFTEKLLRPSGRALVASVRLGAEHELWPGFLRLRGGTYVEPERAEGATARLHLTAGFEVRLFRFTFWDAERRVALAISADFARRYGNVATSLGFWH